MDGALFHSCPKCEDRGAYLEIRDCCFLYVYCDCPKGRLCLSLRLESERRDRILTAKEYPHLSEEKLTGIFGWLPAEEE